MATQECGTCEGVKTIEGEWDHVYVWMCAECCAAERADAELFDQIADAEQTVRSEMAGASLGIDGDTRARARAHLKTARAALYALIDGLTPAQQIAYGRYRAAR